MERLKGFSSVSIIWAGYEPGKRELHVQFAGGEDVYVYEKVPAGRWIALKKADSKGTFINKEIKPFYPYRIEP